MQIAECRGTERQKCVAWGRGIYDVYGSQLMNEDENFIKAEEKVDNLYFSIFFVLII